MGSRFSRGIVHDMSPLWSCVSVLYLKNPPSDDGGITSRRPVGRVVGPHGASHGKSAAKFEGFPAGPHGIPWDPMVFPWDPSGSHDVTHGIPWVPVRVLRVPVGHPTGSRGIAMGSHGTPRDFAGSHGTSDNS